MKFTGCILGIFVAFAIQAEVKKIASLTSCFYKLEKLHRELCGQVPTGGEPVESTCLGWTLDSRRLPSGCYFRIKRL